MSINSRAKGQRGEREMVNILKDNGFDVCRNLDQTRDGGFDILGLGNIALEIKNCATIQLNKWWEQTTAQASGGRIPILAYKIPRKGWFVRLPMSYVNKELSAVRTVTLELDDFIYLLRERMPLSEPVNENQSNIDDYL